MEEYRIINQMLKEAKDWGLEIETIMFALKAIKENPDLSVVEAITIGYNEFIK